MRTVELTNSRGHAPRDSAYSLTIHGGVIVESCMASTAEDRTGSQSGDLRRHEFAKMGTTLTANRNCTPTM